LPLKAKIRMTRRKKKSVGGKKKIPPGVQDESGARGEDKGRTRKMYPKKNNLALGGGIGGHPASKIKNKKEKYRK